MNFISVASATVAVFFVANVFAAYAWAANVSTAYVAAANVNLIIENEMTRWRVDSTAYMNSVPDKYDSLGRAISDDENGSSKNLIKMKDNVRNIITKRSSLSFSGAIKHFKTLASPPVRGNDRVENFVDQYPLITTLEAIEQAQLNSAAVEVQPWSDDYWPIYAGILGNRYGDEAFPHSSDWSENFKFITMKLFFDVFKSDDHKQINSLSPSEKYDLILGAEDNRDQNLTQAMWQQGKKIYDHSGEVESWMGICHGWAPASYMESRPVKSVEVMAHDGKNKIKFYPSDIKALTSLLWATTESPVRFLGGRCNKKDPEQDENGRIIDAECFDTNPMTWHLALVNQLGRAKRSFVFDATYDYQVWNQPIVSYHYKYFNPKTKETVGTIDEARVKLADFSDDKFKKYRSAQTTFIVGITMSVKYVVETRPTQSEEDSPENDVTRQVVYLYDLELDQDDKIIGGEWYSNAHPDFLWSPTADAKPMTVGDYYLLGAPLWDGKSQVPQNWIENSLLSSQRGSPLAKIVDSLMVLSQKEIP